jgi:hypothetical protein
MSYYDDKKLHDAARRLLVSLRCGLGIDVAAANDLRAALQEAAKAWATSDTISKLNANLFVDLASGIEACSHAYEGHEAEGIVALADEIGELIRLCVAVDFSTSVRG